MMSPTIRVPSFVLVCILASFGCNRSNNAEVAKEKARADTAEAEAQSAKAELAKEKARADTAAAERVKEKFRADAAEGQLAKLKAAQEQPKAVDVNRKAAEWILSVGGNMRVIADGISIDIPYSGTLPDGSFEIELVYLPAIMAVGNPKVTDAGIRCLAGLTGVHTLNLSGIAQLHDFAFLARMTNLRELYASGTDLDDMSLANMKALTKLTTLSIFSYGENHITDAGLENLKGMAVLRNLELSGTRITDAGLERLKTLTKLEYLGIGSYGDKSRISDAGLKHLAEMGELRRLIIVMTDITDAGLEHIKKLPNLQVLRLEKTKIAEASVAALKKALPKCEVQFVPK